MARFCSAIIVAAMLGTVATAGAQAPATTDKPQTISGCLQRTDAGTYVLTNVDLRSVSSGAVATSGSGTTKLPVIGMIPPSVSLRQFVDQKVEVAGIVRDSPTANPSKFTRSASPALATPSRVPPKSEGFSSRLQATPASVKNATSTGNGPYMRCEAPNGRSNGNRNSTLPTSRRLPINRSKAG